MSLINKIGLQLMPSCFIQTISNTYLKIITKFLKSHQLIADTFAMNFTSVFNNSISKVNIYVAFNYVV